MRGTWLRNHLASGTSPIELLHLAGIKNLAALQNALAFVPKTGHTRLQSQVENGT